MFLFLSAKYIFFDYHQNIIIWKNIKHNTDFYLNSMRLQIERRRDAFKLRNVTF